MYENNNTTSGIVQINATGPSNLASCL